MAGLSDRDLEVQFQAKDTEKCQSIPRITLICSIDGLGVLSIRQIGFSEPEMCCTHDSQKIFLDVSCVEL